VIAPARIAFLLLLLFPQDAAWKAGFASVRITPASPIPLAGYAGRSAPFEGVAHELYVKALALEDAGGRRALLVTADHIGWGAEISVPLADELVRRTGLKRDAILLNASHTHSGPRLTLTPGARSGVTEEDAAAGVAYTKGLQEKTVEAARNAVADLSPARLSWGKGTAGFVANRRERTERGIVLGVNPDGPVDRSVPVLRVDALDGRLRGIVFGAACHYVDGTFVFQQSKDACEAKSPQSGAKFNFWHPNLVTLHVWLWYPNPAGLYSGINPLVKPFNAQ